MRAACTPVVAALTFLACAAPPGAQAQITMAMQAGNLHYTVTDLAPADGVAAGAVFGAPPRATLSNRLVVTRDADQLVWASDPVVDVPTVVDRNFTAWAQADVHTGIAFDGTNLVAAGIIEPVGAGGVTFHEWATGTWTQFALSPHTRITFTADAAYDFTLFGRYDTDASGWGDAYLELIHSTNGGASALSAPIMDGISDIVANHGSGTFERIDAQQQRALTVTWDNDGDTWERGDLALYAEIDAAAGARPASAVPEPGAWAMLLLGCGLLAGRRPLFARSAR